MVFPGVPLPFPPNRDCQRKEPQSFLRGLQWKADRPTGAPNPAPIHGRAYGGELAYRVLSSARFCLLVFSRGLSPFIRMCT